MEEEIVISVKGLSQRYGKGRIIYDNLSFDVPKGRILGLLGKNGTGKTTTINILMGYLRPQSGVCKIFGEDITKMSAANRERIAEKCSQDSINEECAVCLYDYRTDRAFLFSIL